MAVSANNPRLSNQIKSDVPEIQQKEAALLKMDPTNVADLEVGSKRLTEISSGNWQFQMWNGSQWVNVGKLKMDVDTVDGYDASITPKANTVAVRGSDGKLQDSITGNAATADSAVTISTTLEVGKGGTGATSSEQARRNLGVPPTSHASANTTYGISSETVYGHAKASSDAPAQDTDAGAVGTKTSEFARGDHSHKKVLGNADTYGQVKLTDSVSDGSDASSSVAASAKAVKDAYDEATKKFPSSGGTLTGAINLYVVDDYIGRITAINDESPGKSIFIDTWEQGDMGAYLCLYKGSDTSNPGGFLLGARNADGTIYRQLTGHTNGDLWWDNKRIVRSVNGVLADVNGNVPLAVAPVGMVYIQFPDCAAPADIFGGTWSNISSAFAGAFFRAEGGNAVAFGKWQDFAAPDLYGYLGAFSTFVIAGAPNGVFAKSSPGRPWGIGGGNNSEDWYSYDFSAHRANRYYGAANEIRPVNVTVRIWRRTA